ncbi:hypothetical protein UA08_04075 [Talaromyces atroroseus]|uniref:Uncharacterized protein n=1 Tax=Talaromyces atroroseus TaxID=1441469 RepID=A0A1Q5Q8B5_TALAT|nr:hypothetical protein UA08_04075 [Talaromyces atroroseus]OKL60302.1 hypothetical protein UA08_04075 [Talaromyces atroroseus]
MQSILPEPSPHKAGRRVLGEKTTNASLTTAAKRIADAPSQKTSTAAIPFNVSSNAPQGNSRAISPETRHAGQKRTIDQVVEDISEVESEPRKVFMTSQPEGEQGFKIFDDGTGTKASQTTETSPAASTAPRTVEALVPRQTEEGISQKSTRNESKEDHVSRVPTEPAARRIFIQQRATLARSRLQSAMRRIENKSLDRALSQFEAANGRPFLRYISSSSSPSTPNAQQGQQTPTKQKRVLLPPLPLQARSRPVRSSAQRTTPSSTSNIDIPKNAEDEEDNVDDDEDDNEKTPKTLSDVRQQHTTADSEGAEVAMSQESDSLMDKLVKWTQSSTDSNHAIEA